MTNDSFTISIILVLLEETGFHNGNRKNETIQIALKCSNTIIQCNAKKHVNQKSIDKT